MRESRSLSYLARMGFADLEWADEQLRVVASLASLDVDDLIAAIPSAADPDQALSLLAILLRRSPEDVSAILAEERYRIRLVRVLGASKGLGDFFSRHPAELAVLADPRLVLPTAEEARTALLDAVGGHAGFASFSGEEAWTALRVRYRRLLARVAAYDLEQADPVAGLDRIAAVLADLAAAALEASLSVARTTLSTKGLGLWFFDRESVAATRLAIIGMGKAGARELNYVSDVDVIFVGEAQPDSELTPERAIEIATRLAMLTMRGINESGLEPGLWEVDPNLRPEGKDGALVRSLDSHIVYYDRWAKSWEFQALLKARPLAGDVELGLEYVAATAPRVWSSASREGFVESAQKMRERVTQHIPADDVHYQIKLGPGGLRDIEFTVQLLQLVHGQTDDEIHQTGTIAALTALADRGYIGRAEQIEFAEDYRILRLLEHRLQLRFLKRTHLMPRDELGQRVLARATDLEPSAAQLIERWNGIKHRVRNLHVRLFYRPLLAAVAGLSADEVALTSLQAEARLAAIGFIDPRGALKHIEAMTSGVSRKANIQRHLLPVMLQWFADGADPDYGLLAFRRLSDSLGDTYWFLRMLRDSSGAASRLTHVLSASRYVGQLLQNIPEAAAWLENEDELRPRPRAVLDEEMRAIIARHDAKDAAASALRAARRREVLRLAISSILGIITVDELARGLTDVTTVLLTGITTIVRKPMSSGADGIDFAIIGMGRLGGREVGFGSDTDVMYVYRARSADNQTAASDALAIATEIKRLTEDNRLPLDIDIDLRPEGKNGAVVRSLDSYRAYYARWSLTWEAQALLRARGLVGDESLIDDFEQLADTVRFPTEIAEKEVREVKRIKARVENERLPQGTDPLRHLKLGRGSLSDVEWLVQLTQLQWGSRIPSLRTTSTLEALDAAVAADLVTAADASTLRAAWVFASRARSAVTLWANKNSDVLPSDRKALDGIARLLEYPPGSATTLEEDYLGVTRRARAVFERLFYGS
ncbi:bifunctional [glutamine synthetase] adenylyltransferase/[glutamine synthetase]-adenylyl-L-tyrosine phosphorylase [Agreia pratensis]|uniref:bifunctional [glutamine synthetase] adenylyltransferase/[glutamine synthetase]-adenylyl-L-tyrosine phosphorylase n=1 Tax=Agreia pratensis TaxID=150121 RepID=UPI00188A001A|nr:bifunctional [glutamine synthetase] adenylyltransferase/[glutamine synthetase]-adenylyl-L-tyrosine phosphorylase [Agreia pratensis]MBF4634222.1 bifunctional [glutamine synthetase] adenylyltransferase/[glutamine synthetase]-adenylyl-L-tyrosine phosphorylase [Agreia pratensis]